MLYLFLFIVGASVGSFLNAVIYRLPLDLSIAKGRSRCPHCNSQLRELDLVPLLSFIWLGGKCRKCHHKISWQYFIIELVTAGLTLALWQLFGPNVWLFLFWLAIALHLILLALFDLKYLILPDKVLLSMLFTAVAVDVCYRVLGKGVIIGYGSGLLGALLIAGFFWLIWRFSKGQGLGFGDVKLGAVIGLLYGLLHALFVIYVAVILGGVVAITLLVLQKASWKTKLPLGSFIALSGTLTILFNPIINRILNNLIL